MKRILLIVPALLTGTMLYAQQRISDGTAPAPINPAAVLELQSTNKGFLPSRVALTDRLVWAPMTGTATKGMVVYNTTAGGANSLDTGLVVWEGVWNPISNGSSADYWRLKGNQGTTPPTTVGTAVGTANFWGTIDAKNLAVGTNSTTRAIFDQNGTVTGGEASYSNPGSSRNIVWGLNDSVIAANNQNAVFGAFNSTSGGNNLVSGIQNRSGANHSVVGGGFNTLVAGADFSAVYGNNNTVLGISALVSGSSNADSAGYTLVSGQNNVIRPGAQLSIVGGNGNNVNNNVSVVYGTANSVNVNNGIANGGHLVFGQENVVSGTNSFNSLVGGFGNVAYNADIATVLGALNKDSASYSLVSGNNNVVGAGATGSVISGQNNIIGSGASLSVVGGSINSVVAGAAASTIFGSANKITNSGNVATGPNLGINTVLGYSNTIDADGNNNVSGFPTTHANLIAGNMLTNISSADMAMFGIENIASRSESSVVGGRSNILYNAGDAALFGVGNVDSANGSLVSGTNNFITPSGAYSVVSGSGNSIAATATVVGGAANSLLSTAFSSAVFGHSHVVSSPASLVIGTSDSVMTQGEGNIVFGQQNYLSGVAGQQNNLVGGTGNRVTGANNVVVFGGDYNADAASFSMIHGSHNSIVAGADYGHIMGNTNSIGSGGSYSTILGQGNSVSAPNSFSTGFNNTISGGGIANGNTTIGNDNIINNAANAAHIIGSTNTVSAPYGFAIGQNCVIAATHDNSFVCGNGATTTAANQFVGKFNAGYNLYTNPAGTIGVTTGAGGTSWASISDRRSKEHIQNINYGLNEVMALRPTMYRYKGNQQTSLGFIAQEVKTIVPEVVEQTTMGPDHDYLAVRYTELIPVLTKAIQEQQAEIEALKAQNAKLTAQANEAAAKEVAVAELQQQMRELQQMIGMKPGARGAKTGLLYKAPIRQQP